MKYEDHPCFSENGRHYVARIHLPVAPKCNMQCNYCNRDFDCVNESRPGVTCAVLDPARAADYLDAVMERIDNIRVVGIAGPGDPFANPEETLTTLRLVRKRHPEMTLCLATSGLDLSPYVGELANLDVSHVTITVNAVDVLVGRWIYSWARYGKRMYRGAGAAAVILEKQMESIALLKEKGMTVKINTVVIPGINDEHIVEIARRMAEMKADIHNCMPIYHIAGTAFAGIMPPSPDRMKEIRRQAQEFMPQMSHCFRCRSDAAGLIGQPQSEAVTKLLKEAAAPRTDEGRPFVAVASMEGLFVNQHLGEARALWIFRMNGDRIDLVERRPTPPPGGGGERWTALADRLRDCHTVLASGIGSSPHDALTHAGIRVVIMEGLAAEGIEAVFAGREVPKVLLRTPARCGIGRACAGTGTGCG
jgi:nitrogen fixation protein NifB